MRVRGLPSWQEGLEGVYDLETQAIFVSRDVQFHENEFPFVDNVDLQTTQVTVDEVSTDNVGVDVDFLDDLEHVLEVGEFSLEQEDPEGVASRLILVSRSPPAAHAHSLPNSLGHSPPMVSSPLVDAIAPAPYDSSASSSEVAPVAVSLDLGRGLRERHPQVGTMIMSHIMSLFRVHLLVHPLLLASKVLLTLQHIF